ncbi:MULTISPECIES: LytTR family DNA-binding domain-containing protein [unclassified Jeotgalibaca]|uniref:LytTR family DNA-binding domain-containing protein n=1 Tax=unclassified Jeotgalibaca TaxID=2621505 RepID=UPI003FCFF5DD
MRIRIEKMDAGENEVILHIRELDAEMQATLDFLQASSSQIFARKEKETVLISPHAIYFVEAVDNRVFLYTKADVLEVTESLMKLEENYQHAGFVRIGKSQLVNLHHIQKLRSLLNSRIEITLENGEKMIVSRHYAPAFKQRLGMELKEG